MKDTGWFGIAAGVPEEIAVEVEQAGSSRWNEGSEQQCEGG